MVVQMDAEVTQDDERTRNMLKNVAKCPSVIKEPGD